MSIMMGIVLWWILFSAFYLHDVSGQIDSCWLTTCEKVIDIQNSNGQILINQGDLATEVMEIAESLADVNGSVSQAILVIQNDILTSETNVLGAISSSESTLTTAISSSQSVITSALSSSETVITSAISTSESNIIDTISSSASTITGAISSSESTITDTISTSESTITGAVSSSQSTITGAIKTSESTITGAISTSESIITGTISTSESTITNAILASESTIEGKITASESAITSAISTSETAIKTAVSSSESTITGALSTSESTITSAISISQTTVTDAISTSESNIIGEISKSETKITAAVSTSESTISEAISTSESTITGAISSSESSVTSSISTLKMTITDAISNSESTITTGISASESVITTAISTSESTITGVVSTSESIITGAISSSETTITNAISSSETSIKSSVGDTETNILDVLNNDVIPLLNFPRDGTCFIESTNIQEFQIELDIFSGVVNPTWTVTSSSGDFNGVKGVLTQAASTSLPSLVAYRGFVVTTLFNDGGEFKQTFGKGQQPSTSIEITLLNSNDGTLNADVVAIAFAGINGLPPPDIGTVDPLGSVISGIVNAGCGRSEPCLPPIFDTAPWMSTSDNCYNYAAQKSTGTFAQPGRAGGVQYTTIDGTSLRAACVLDVIKDLDDEAPGVFPSDNNCLIVLAIIPGTDFHFYRRDSDGNWSHKPGPRPPTTLDNSGNPITDPRTADIAPYKYVRFLSVCPRKNSVL